MNIPINPEHVRKRRQKYGTDGDFITMPAPRPEPTRTENISGQKLAHTCREDSAVAATEAPRELVRS